MRRLNQGLSMNLRDRIRIRFMFRQNSIVLIFFHILVLREFWVLTENRIPPKTVLWGVRVVALSISCHEQTQ